MTLNPYLETRLTKHDALVSDMDALLTTAAGEDRDLTDAEQAAYRGMAEQCKEIETEVGPLRDVEMAHQRMRTVQTELAGAAQVRAAQPPTATGQLARYTQQGAGAWLADWGAKGTDPEARARLQRAHAEYRVVADQKLADNPGVVPVPILGDVINLLNATRPFCNSVTQRPMPASGATFTRPKITQHVSVGKQATEKTQLASQKMTITPATVTKQTFGGTLDISFQDRDWTDPAILAIAVSDFADVYAQQTDNDAADTFAAAVTGTFVLGASPASGAVRSAVLNAANQIAANIGRYPDTVWLAPDQAAQLGAIVETGSAGLPSFPGMSQIGPTGELMGLRAVIDANFAAGTFIIGNSSFVEFYEQVGGLLSVTEPTILGYTIAFYGYTANFLLDTGSALKRSLT